jgi:hypothetical protein
MKFLVSYDAHHVRDYTRLYRLLAQLSAVRLHYSLWIVEGQFDAAQLRNAIRGALDADDSVAVLELPNGAKWATYRVRPTAIDALGGFQVAA